MRSNIVSWSRGYVTVAVRGERTVELINDAVARNIGLWDIHRSGENRYEMKVLIEHFFLLRPLLKKTGTKVHVTRRKGLPFLMDKLGRRKFFAAGFVVFVIGLYLLSSVIWQVKIEGNEKISSQRIMEAAEKLGIRPLQWKFRLESPDVLTNQLMTALPGAAWIGFEMKGAQARIHIVETKLPVKKPLMNPRNLVAKTDAVITKMLVEKGRPMVKLHSRVKKGDILVSGVLGDGENRQIVVSNGNIRGLVWHEYDISVPLIQQSKVYTGESKKRKYLVIGNRAFMINGYGKLKYILYETEDDRNILQWKDHSLYIGWMDEKIREVHYVKQNLNVQEAKGIGLQQARAEILLKSGLDAKIIAEKILHVKSESGKVYMKVLFEVDEEITKEQPIIPASRGE
ncbi:MAG TPA: sporulation protein YqfD [Bacilli bacterium]